MCSFLFTEIKDETERNQVLRLLVTLLPVANRDTLYALLNFLNVVVRHSSDQRDINGTEVSEYCFIIAHVLYYR